MSNVAVTHDIGRGTPVENPVATLGGKGANLDRLGRAAFDVPDGFVVTADAYRRFVDAAGIADDLEAATAVDADDREAVERAAKRARELVLGADLPAAVQTAVTSAYVDLGGRVAVRSSATAEDLPEASFAGQQDTFLNVTGRSAVVDRVRECWASLFTPRAIAYRAEQGFAEEEVAIAVVVQRQVDAEKSGVLFTADPSTGASEATVEAALGLGEAVVSGEVSPDSYVLDRDSGDLLEATIQTQRRMCVPTADGTTFEPVPKEKRDARVLDNGALNDLLTLAAQVEDHYGAPQDVEWAVADGDLFVLQSRPITTIDGDAEHREANDGDDALVTGLGASPGVTEGEVVFDPIEAVKRSKDGRSVVLVREMTSPSDMHGIKAAAGILTSEGGRTCHAAIVARELDKPAVVGCEDLAVDADRERATVGGRSYGPGTRVRLDGEAGTVTVVE